MRIAFVEDNFLRWENFLNNSWLDQEHALLFEGHMLTRWESYVDTYIRYLARRGFECVKYVPSRKAKSVQTLSHRLGHTVMRVPIGESGILGADARRFIGTIKELEQNQSTSFAHFNTYYSRFFAATAFASMRTKVVTEYSGGGLPQTFSLERLEWLVLLRRALGRAVGVMVSDLSLLDRREAEVLVKTLNLRPSKLFSFPIVAVDESTFYERSREDSRQRLGFNPEVLNVLVVSGMTRRVSSLGPTKDPMLILKMFNSMKRIQQNWHLHFVGFGPAYQEVVAEVHRMNLDQRVTFHGLVNHEDLPYYYSASDLVVYPFPQFDLQSGTAVNEALSCARPVACFKAEPGLETEQSGGYLVDTDIASGSSQLGCLLSRPEDLRQKGRVGVSLAEKFMLRNVGPRLEEIYQILAAR